MRLAVLGLPLLGGCLRYLVGTEVGAAPERPTYVTAAVGYGVMTDRTSFEGTTQLRVGTSGAELSLGAMMCRGTHVGDWIVDGCGRLYALELGWRRDHVSFGTMSPAIGPALTHAVWPRPVHPGLNDAVYPAFTAQLWVGLDTRVPTSDIAPYVGLQLGYGQRTSQR
jgi:hypothetical protein